MSKDKCYYDLRYNCIKDNNDCENCKLGKKLYVRKMNSILKNRLLGERSNE